MAQRGGAVQSHMRISSDPIYSDLIPEGHADIILSVEPLETLRYLNYLAPEGRIVSSSTPMVNIPDYPDLEEVLARLRAIQGSVVVDSGDLAKDAGSGRAQNMVMLGAAANFLMIGPDDLREFIEVLFRPRGQNMVDINLKAFELGRQATNPT
jgi:indolepyruvate ferredoxin oxidoreductase beta subunit